MSIQLNKYIASSGFCSRREADKLIDQGRVTVNGIIADKTTQVEGKFTVCVDDEPIYQSQKMVYIAFNKPVGITCTTDLKDKTNIISFINHDKRIFPIGRLDKDSQGLILLTNDGDIVNTVLRAENNHEKEYLVQVHKPLEKDFAQKMRMPMKIDGIMTKPCKVKVLGKQKFSIILTQGLNRQIRKMSRTLGYKVLFLQRTRIMHIALGDLKLGRYRNLTPMEIQKLKG
ncbi:MAG: pseudouridine synthase [Chitinophagales bacterium]|jgi:23S rRNA pseudouridine2604 synthase|nr:pseudouridine synthase [Chitinophagales bacterium]